MISLLWWRDLFITCVHKIRGQSLIITSVLRLTKINYWMILSQCLFPCGNEGRVVNRSVYYGIHGKATSSLGTIHFLFVNIRHLIRWYLRPESNAAQISGERRSRSWPPINTNHVLLLPELINELKYIIIKDDILFQSSVNFYLH